MVQILPIDRTHEQLPEKRVSLAIDWGGYQTIRTALGEGHAAHLTYYNGLLEIMTPLEAHQHSSGLIGQFIEILTEELDLTIKSMESTTLIRPDLSVGAEPDQGYYIANEPLVRGKTVNLRRDPPPDLVLEVDITHSDIDKNRLYTALGVPEFWRYNGSEVKIYQLQSGSYREVSQSQTFPTVPTERLYQFLRDCSQQGETQAKRDLRQWIRHHCFLPSASDQPADLS